MAYISAAYNGGCNERDTVVATVGKLGKRIAVFYPVTSCRLSRIYARPRRAPRFKADFIRLVSRSETDRLIYGIVSRHLALTFREIINDR